MAFRDARNLVLVLIALGAVIRLTWATSTDVPAARRHRGRPPPA